MASCTIYFTRVRLTNPDHRFCRQRDFRAYRACSLTGIIWLWYRSGCLQRRQGQSLESSRAPLKLPVPLPFHNTVRQAMHCNNTSILFTSVPAAVVLLSPSTDAERIDVSCQSTCNECIDYLWSPRISLRLQSFSVLVLYID